VTGMEDLRRQLDSQATEPVITTDMSRAECRAEIDRWLAERQAQHERLDEEHLLLGIGRTAAVLMTHELIWAWPNATADRWFRALPERYMTPDSMRRPDWDHSHYPHDEHGHIATGDSTMTSIYILTRTEEDGEKDIIDVSADGDELETRRAQMQAKEDETIEPATFAVQTWPVPLPIPAFDGWTDRDLRTLIITAGEIAAEYGTGTDELDRYDVLSTHQRSILAKAEQEYRAELGVDNDPEAPLRCATCGELLERVDVHGPDEYVHAGDEPPDGHAPQLPAAELARLIAEYGTYPPS
jgi:hypothetical protein